jgi:hypothetical protein
MATYKLLSHDGAVIGSFKYRHKSNQSDKSVDSALNCHLKTNEHFRLERWERGVCVKREVVFGSLVKD